MKSVGLLLTLLLFSLPASAESSGGNYARRVRVDWPRIEGAVRYDVEWVRAAVCRADRAQDKISDVEQATSSSPYWQESLDAGRYCIRVRGVAVGGQEGQWSEYQELIVKPKPPREVRRGEKVDLVWDPVPHADGYEVEVRNARNELIFKKSVNDPQVDIPDSVFSSRKLKGKDFSIAISTASRGIPSSVPIVQSFTLADLGAPGEEDSFRTAREMPPQPAPQALPPEEAVERYEILGERPVMPTITEWRMAKTPQQKETLRRRTIASARVELKEEVDRQTLPDLKVSGGSGLGFYYFKVSNDGAHGTAPLFHLRTEYRRDKAWGAFWDIDLASLEKSNGKSEFQSSIALGLSRNFKLDPYGQSFFRVGFGVDLVSLPVLMLNLHSPGLRLRLEHEYRFNDRFSLSNRFQARAGPPLESMAFPETSSTAVVLGGVSWHGQGEYRFTPEFSLSGGPFVQVIGGSSGSTGVSFYQGGAELRASYRATSAHSRRPAAIYTARKREGAKVWKLDAHFPFVVRSLSGGGINPADFVDLSTTGYGADFSVRGRLGAAQPWYVALGGRYGNLSREARLGFGYEDSILDRDDMRGFSEIWVGWRSETLAASEVTFYAWSPGARLGVSKRWTSRLKTESSLRLGFPLSVHSGGGTQASGWNIIAAGDLAAEYDLTHVLALRLGYRLERARLGTYDGETGLSNRWIDLIDHQILSGVSLTW